MNKHRFFKHHRVLILTIYMAWCNNNSLFSQTLSNNEITPYSSSVAFLNILPDARSQALGGLTAGTEPDPYVLFTNFAKSVFASYESNYSMTYSPLFLNLGITNIHYTNMSYFKTLNTKHSIGGGIRYISYGDFDLMDENANPIATVFSYGASLEFGYAYKLRKNFSVSLNLRVINSALATDLGLSSGGRRNILSLAGDFGMYYVKYNPKKNIKYSAGFNLSNLGGRLSKFTSNYFGSNTLPLKISFDGGIAKYFQYEHKIFVGAGVAKVLLPPVTNNDSTETKDNQISNIFTTLFGSDQFNKGWYYSLGTEYAYRDIYFLRAGLRYRNIEYGGGSYFALGAGIVFRNYNFGIDFSYLAPIALSSNNSDPNYNSVKISFYIELIPAKFIPENIRCAKIF